MTKSDEPIWLTRAVVEAAHAEQVREHGGLLGVRDPGLLESALARPRQRWSLDPATDLLTLAASYGFGLTKNHAFMDGNKRIGFVAMNVFLILNGSEIDAPEPEVVSVMLELAAGALGEADLAGWLTRVVVPLPRPSGEEVPAERHSSGWLVFGSDEEETVDPSAAVEEVRERRHRAIRSDE